MASRFLFFPASFVWALGALAAPPVLDDPVPLDNGGNPSQVAPKVFVGKALVFPLTATDADGDLLRYKVTSSNPDILVRVRTGHPLLRLSISHAGDGTSADPAFAGEMEFALLRDFTPITSDIIAGLAQGNFYDNQVFHRIADLDPSAEPNGSVIIQGGDPLGTGQGGPGFQFENEFQAALIFGGRGQLAMANAGSSPANYKGTNGSQFFITDGSPRFLDFNHTIFGQLLRGWPLLDRLANVPRNAQDKPLVDVRIVDASVEPNFHDALLLLSAIAPGSATITVQVDDGSSSPVSKSFIVRAVRDKFNDPPFLEPVLPKIVAKNSALDVPLRAVDLESDFLFFGNRVFSANGQSSGSGNPARFAGNTGYTGPLPAGVSVMQYDQTYRGAIDGPERANDDLKPVSIGVGDRAIDADAISFDAVPGVGLTSQVVARYTDADPRGLPADFTAQINWGDGTPLTAGTIARDPARPGIARFVVTGAHTYQTAGVYPVTVELTGNKGAKTIKRGMAVVTANSLKAIGTDLAADQGRVDDRVVATFSDAPAGRASDYTANINWGDGRISSGTVRAAGEGTFQVLGSHTFKDAGNFLVTVRIRKAGAPAASDAIAWSLAKAGRFAAAKHLPPFDIAHLIGQISEVEVPGSNGQFKPVRTTEGSQTFLNVELIVINAGDLPSAAGKLRFYLSADDRLNLSAETLPDPARPGQTFVNPADRLVTIATEPEGNLQALAPGQGVRYIFDQGAAGDLRLRLPAGENGSSFNLLAHFDYHDPIGDHLPIAREVVFGPFNGFVVKPISLSVQEAAGAAATKTFTVKMDRAPTAPVTITLSVDRPAEVEATPLTLTFTPENFSTKQTVTVTAKDDAVVDGSKNVRISLQPAVSDDRQWKGIDPNDVAVLVLDKAPTP